MTISTVSYRSHHVEPYVVKGRSRPVVPETSHRRLFETANYGILILDAFTGRIRDVNPFMEKMLECSQADLVGKELWQIGRVADIDANRAAFCTLRENGYVRYEDLPLQTKTGHEVEVEFVNNIYVAADIHVAQCNIREITDGKRRERAECERSEKLVDLNRRKDEFLAMLSHELRSPLPALLNAAQLFLHESSRLADRQKAAAAVDRQVKRLTALIDELLEVARVTTGRVHLRREFTDVRGIVENATETVRPLLERHKHTLSLLLPPDPVWLNVDAGRVEQVVVNLLTNAAKYTPDEGVISLVVEKDGAEVALRVRDTGAGISAEVLPHIFDLFAQAKTSLDRSEGGLGVGLSLVQRIVEAHGGTVAAFSPGEGLGSEFAVRLPALLLAAPLTSVAPSAHVVESPAKKRRLLVVDDDTDSADTLADLLRLLGHDVRVAYSGPAALAEAVESPPDAVLLDVGLPEMNGYEVASRLRRNPKVEINGVYLIAMTGYGSDADRRLSREAGFNQHFVKPVEFPALKRILAQLDA